MLQINKRAPVDEPRVVAETPSPAEILSSYTHFLRRQFPVILVVVLLATAFGIVYLLTTPPRYTAHATLLIDSAKTQIFQQPAIITDPVINAGMVDSQVEILKSENISLAVINQLRLGDDPEFTGPAGGLVGRLAELVAKILGSSTPKSEFELTRTAVSAFADRLTVRRVGLSYLIDLGFTSPNPDRAAQIANAIGEAYIDDQLQGKYQATRRASFWLQDRIHELRDQATTAERAVVEFRAQHNIVATGTGGRLLNEQQLMELNTQVGQARAQTAEAKARLDRVDEIRRAGAPDATVNESLRSDVINKLRQQYLDLKNKEADWSARYGKEHLAAINLRNQMFEIRKSIFDELERVAESTKSDYEIAKQREDVVQKAMAEAVVESKSTSQAQIALRELESTAQTSRTLHDNFLQRYMESLQQQSFPITDARVVTAASRPMGKSSPKAFLVLAVAGCGGIVLGFGLAALRDMSDRVFRTTAQVEELLQTDSISVVPYIKSTDANVPRKNLMWQVVEEPLSRLTEAIRAIKIAVDINGAGKSNKVIGITSAFPNEGKSTDAKSRALPVIDAAVLGPRTIVPRKNLMWQVVEKPLSRFTEAIRAIKIAVDINEAEKSKKVIGITSAFPNEGKSTISCALAQLIAHAGSRVILVDCDLRNPSLTRALAPNMTTGLRDVISGTTPLEKAIWTDPSTKLDFLPAALKSRFAHTSEVLRSDAIKWLFEKLREDYDYVVVDLPPLAPVVDTRSTGQFVDSYVLVVEWGQTQRDAVEHALTTARSVYQNLLGVVLNKADTKALSRYEGYYGMNKYSRYYSRYGYTDA